jgi:asparagine synthase (glutamine-hydrolysing)
MDGICGVLRADGKRVEPAVLRGMADSMGRRDVEPFEAGPGGAARVALAGSSNDAERVARLYEERGEGFPGLLRGAFAIALWDPKAKKLLLVRDPLGGKSLYYALHEGAILVASEIKALLAYPGFKPRVRLEAIHQYLTYQYVPGPGTVYEGVGRVPPGTLLAFEGGRLAREVRYWRPDFRRKADVSFEDACARIRELALESVRACMRTELPLGAFLSGGVDSSVVVGLMSGLSKGPVKTFSVVFEEPEFSELRYAKLVMDRCRADAQVFTVRASDARDLLPKLAWHYDQPFADSSALPTYCVCREAGRSVRVALNGDCGDENFGGYLRYLAIKGSQVLGVPFRLLGKEGTRRLASVLPQVETTKSKSMFKHMHRLFSALAEPPERRNMLWHSYFTHETKMRVYGRDMKERFGPLDAGDYLAEVFRQAPAEDVVDRSICTDLDTYLPECLIIKMETAAAANGIEARAPFATRELFEFTASLPSSWKIRGLTTKYIMKRAFGDLLPREILRREKKGFGIPLGKWFRVQLKDYLRDVLFSAEAMNRGYFDRKGLRDLVDEHIDGVRDHGYRLWALLMLEHWHRVFTDK